MFVVISYCISRLYCEISTHCFDTYKKAEIYVKYAMLVDEECGSQGDFIYKIVEFPELAKLLNETR